MSKSAMEIPAFRVFYVGAAPVIRQLIDAMGLIERIDRRSPVKKEDCKLSVGIRIAALIINQLTERRALYKVEEFIVNKTLNCCSDQAYRHLTLMMMHSPGPWIPFTKSGCKTFIGKRCKGFNKQLET